METSASPTTKICNLCDNPSSIESFINPQSGNERDHCRECWKRLTKKAALERREQAKLRQATIQAPTPPVIPPQCPRCGGRFAYTDTDGDVTCGNCNELLASFSNYRREMREFRRIQRTTIRGLGRPRKDEVLVVGLRAGIVLNENCVFVQESLA